MKVQKWLDNGFIAAEVREETPYGWHHAILRISDFRDTVTFNLEVDNKADRKKALRKLVKIATVIDVMITKLEEMK